MIHFTVILMAGVIAFAVLMLATMASMISNGELRTAVPDILFSVIFALTLFATSYVFRPKEGLKHLAEIDELLDETLTEVGDS